ncbi:HdeD family acid-resistance protein [Azorhizobium doebereinerae]|uniref:HdeD family acid-resistance protein n=1 Tax=Azorhizobium doebereinerae TaxID=281091 RepID=UPI0004076CBE|nr:hypothetical protein [Azorhizobium doebereinerae]
MVQLALLLIGADAVRRRWWVLAGLGVALLACAALLIGDLVDGFASTATQAFGVVFLLEGIVALSGLVHAQTLTARLLRGVKAALMLLVGFLVLDHPMHSDAILAWLLGLSLIADGLWRLGTIALVRYRRWPLSAALVAGEVVLAVLIIVEWPLPHSYNVPLCLSLLLAGWGVGVLRIGLWLRNEPEEVAFYALPAFGTRNWNENAPVLVRSDTPEPPPEGVLTVRIWTPVGSADVKERRPVIERYIGARDVDGAMSTGHSALEYNDLYISHWPGADIDANSPVTRLFHGREAANMPGRFQPSYAAESAEWCPADQKVELRHFSPRRLRAYWAGYKQDSIYNLTNRNCSVAVAGALDSALEGVLDCRFPLLRVFALQLNPDLWAAAYLRARAQTMCWTPGMVLDYARALQRIVDSARDPWHVRALAFLRRLRTDRSLDTATS